MQALQRSQPSPLPPRRRLRTAPGALKGSWGVEDLRLWILRLPNTGSCRQKPGKPRTDRSRLQPSSYTFEIVEVIQGGTLRPLQQHLASTAFLRQLTLRYLSISLLISASAGFAQSSLLESVKRNPSEAQALCQSFKAMNGKGQSALSTEAINQLATQRNLSPNNAEILATYVIGLHCSDVR